MPNDPDTRTLPPDPSVPGLYWLRSGDWWRVWEWKPDMGDWRGLQGFWRTGDSAVLPQDAHAGGWRCIAEAVPPEGA